MPSHLYTLPSEVSCLVSVAGSTKACARPVRASKSVAEVVAMVVICVVAAAVELEGGESGVLSLIQTVAFPLRHCCPPFLKKPGI